MATEAQIAANRLNATRSTGPRTEAGKAASRRNALVHGLAGEGVVLPEEMNQELDERLAGWAEDFRPATRAEAFLVRAAAVESVKYDHATRHRFAALAMRLRHAEADWDAARRRQVESLVASLDEVVDPAPICRALQETAEGCAWMIRQWEILDDQAETCGRWHVPHLAMCLTLVGAPRVQDDAGPEARTWIKLRTAIEPVPHLDRLADRKDLDAEDEAKLDAYAEAMDAGVRAVRAAVAIELSRLSAIRSELEETLDGPDRAEAGRRALFDAKQDMPLRRYETASLREVSRALDQLAKLRKGAEAEWKAHHGGAEHEKTRSGRSNPSAPPVIPPCPPCLRGASPVPPPTPARNEPNFAATAGVETLPISASGTPAAPADRPGTRPAGPGSQA